jgi:predicted secreted hydrolase
VNVKILFFIFCWPFSVFAQGFSDLGSRADGFANPELNPTFSFPTDHGAHPEYRIEWWYLTANLNGSDGTAYGLQWTLFRTGLTPGEAQGWRSPQVWFAHAAVTTPGQHFATERFARGGIGQAGVEATPFRAWIDEWVLEGEDFQKMTLTANGPNFGYDMSLQANGPLVFHGDKGYSVKSEQGQASYYYSQPFFKIDGTLKLPTGNIEVVGNAWLDREWSSQPLSDDQFGWDWFSLSFVDGAKLMGFQLRQLDGSLYSSSTWITPDGSTSSYPNGAFSAIPLNIKSIKDRNLPIQWRVTLPDKNVDVVVTAQNPDAWMELSIPYWEGPVNVLGSHIGQGYLEMTGYE